MASHFHIVWACPYVQPYWREVTNEISKIMGVELDYSLNTRNSPTQTQTPAKDRKCLQTDPPTLHQGKKSIIWRD